MPNVDYLFTFGSGNPATRGTLSPTFISFVNVNGQTLTPPAITETYTGSGYYKVNYMATLPIFFTMDGATTGLATSERYIAGRMGPEDGMGQTLVGMAATLLATGNSLLVIGTSLAAFASAIGTSYAAFGSSFGNLAALIGSTQSSFGSTSADPTTVFGFLRRAQEFAEGNRAFTKATGVLDYYSRGASTLLREKTITDNTAGTTCI